MATSFTTSHRSRTNLKTSSTLSLFLLCPNARGEMLTEDEARRIASSIAKLLDLWESLNDNDVDNLSDERDEAEDTTPKR